MLSAHCPLNTQEKDFELLALRIYARLNNGKPLHASTLLQVAIQYHTWIQSFLPPRLPIQQGNTRTRNRLPETRLHGNHLWQATGVDDGHQVVVDLEVPSEAESTSCGLGGGVVGLGSILVCDKFVVGIVLGKLAAAQAGARERVASTTGGVRLSKVTEKISLSD